MQNDTAFAFALETFLRARNALDGLPPETTFETETLYGDALSAADDRLIATPANSIAELRTKFEVVFPDENALPQPKHLKALFADLQRLTDSAPSATFNAERWISHFMDCGGGWVVRGGEVLLFGPQTERMAASFFELETRGGTEAVKRLLAASAAQEGEAA